MPEPAEVRLDKWLWAARFFKTRSLATASVQGGHVHLNGARTKPGRVLRAGERLEITKGEARFEVIVLALSDKRGPASVAQTLYRQTEASVRAQEARIEQRRHARQVSPSPSGRPDKKQRRALRRLRDRSAES